MTDTDVLLSAALAGDEDAFHALTSPYTGELHLHCYRMLGSFHDAEDAIQETLLRSWRYLTSFEGRSSFRSWLYRIATNVCLRHTSRRKMAPPVVPPPLVDAVARSTEPAIVLSPYPDALLDTIDTASSDPAAVYDLRESVQLAFLAAVQNLPPRQRAVLILRDVLGWSAAEVADLLDSTAASVNGALNRARSTMAHRHAEGRFQIGRTPPADEAARALVRGYVEAWDEVDVAKLARLLRDDVVVTMPPLPLRYAGIEAAKAFYAMMLRSTPSEALRRIETRANRQPALAIYRRDPNSDDFRAWGMFVLTIDGSAIAEVAAFLDPALPPAFGLPASIAGTGN